MVPLSASKLNMAKFAEFLCVIYTHCRVSGRFAKAYLYGPEMKVAWNLLGYFVSSFKMRS